MNKKERLYFILELLEQKETIKVSDILAVLKIDRTTVYRDFKQLEIQNQIKEISK
jgi:DeoR/GlpR family transcriptional regulator of sugar metabolism